MVSAGDATASLRSLPAGITALESDAGMFSAEAFARWKGSELSRYRGYAIGESVHESEHYSRIQAELIKYLVENQGVRIVFFETAVRRSQPLMDYLQRCTQGTREAPTSTELNGLYFPSDHSQIWIDWICDFNRRNPQDPIRFQGMDVWDRPWEHQLVLEQFDETSAIDLKTELAQTRRFCWGAAVKNWDEFKVLQNVARELGGVPDTFTVPCHAALDQIETKLVQHQASSAFRAVQILRARFANLQHRGDQWTGSWNQREHSQAANLISFWKEIGEQKKFLWISHTSHVSEKGSRAPWWNEREGSMISAGEVLKEKYGLDLFTLGLTAYKAAGSQGDWSVPVDSRSLDLRLHSTGRGFLGIDAATGLVTEQDRWFVQNENGPESGVNGVFLEPSEHYDAMIFVDQTLASRPVTTPVSPYYP